MRWTIGTRLFFGFSITVIVLILNSIADYRAVQSLIEADNAREHAFLVLRDLDGVLALLTDAETGQRGFVITGQDSYLDPYRAALPRIDQAQNELRSLTAGNGRQQDRLNKLQAVTRTKLDELATTINLRRDKGPEAAIKIVMENSGKKAMDDARGYAAEIRNDEEIALEQARKISQETVKTATTTMIGTSVGAALLAILVSFLLSRSITNPVAQLVSSTQRIGGGDLKHRVPVEGSDEVADLGRAFNVMTEQREKADREIADQAARREKVLQAITQTVQRLASASQELLAGATQQASGMQEQSAAVAETVTVVDEVAHTSTQAADRAKNVASSARRSEEASRNGRKAVDDVIGVISTAKTQSDEVAERIASLAEQTQAIGEIVALITDIAEQTNLLALNAAIEASRAGEHGRGFTVVATEIKSLADESKKATQRVRQILGDIQKTANTAVLSTEQGTRSMNAAARSAATAGDTIQTLEAVIAEVAEAAAQIAASAGQQATGLAQIHQAMRDISQVSAQNLAATHQAKTAATDLAAMGDTLKSMTEKG